MRRDPEAGISLLETLLALLLLGFIGAALASMMATGARVWDRTEDLTGLAGQGAARLALAQRLEAMPNVGPTIVLEQIWGTELNGFRFLHVVPSEGEPSWSTVAYDEAAGVLSYRDGALPEAAPAQVLYADLGRMELSYYGRTNVYAEAGWSTEWDEAEIPPLIVKVETWRADGTVNPPLVLRPAKLADQLEMSASSLVPPVWPSRP